MKSKDQILLEQAYQSILENDLALYKNSSNNIKPSSKNLDAEVLKRMFNFLQFKAEFYCNITGLKQGSETWTRENATSLHIKPTNLQEIKMEVPDKVDELEQKGYEWTRIFIVAHNVMDPEHENFARTAQLSDITNTLTFINNLDHILVNAYDPYGVMPGKRITIPMPVGVPSMLDQGEKLLASIYHKN